MGEVGAPRLGVCAGPYVHQADPAAWAMVQEVGHALGRKGARVVAYETPPHFAGLDEAVRWISAWEGARSLAWETINHRDRISAELGDGRLRDGAACSPEWYEQCVRLGERCRIEFDAAFDDFDVMLTLAAPGEAPVGLAKTGSAVFNGLWTLLHAPCVTIPGHVGPNGMPLGFQLVGRRHGDRRLLEVARWIERAAF